MGMYIPKWIGRTKSQWLKTIILVVLGFTLFFAPLYGGFYGKFLTFSWIGIENIPAKILAIILFIFAHDVKISG